MGRELNRVPMDFQWPMNKVWKGYLNPYSKHQHTCEHCDGTGLSAQAKHLRGQWYGQVPFRPEDRGSVPLEVRTPAVWEFASRNVERAPEYYGLPSELNIEREARRLCQLFNSAWSRHLNQDDVNALAAANRLYDFTHTFTPGEGWTPRDPVPIPTAAEVNIWALQGMGHDSINCHVVVSAEAARLGFALDCDQCQGEGVTWDSAEMAKLAEEWTREDPPKGDGYQMWETVSEGSPISPVFGTAPELAYWLSANRAGTDEGISMNQWMRFIEGPGWAPTFVGMGDQLVSGVLASSESSE